MVQHGRRRLREVQRCFSITIAASSTALSGPTIGTARPVDQHLRQCRFGSDRAGEHQVGASEAVEAQIRAGRRCEGMNIPDVTQARARLWLGAIRAQPPIASSQHDRAAKANALGDYLRARREQVRPEDVGLLPGTRRRVAGLRREELALLAGISSDYYLRLE
jgi:hypothetical protein